MSTKTEILAVGSNPRNQELLAQFLEDEGFRVRPVATYEAFDTALDAATPFSLALVDITGFDPRIWARCERLRERDIPLLVLSPRQSAAVQQQSLARGARGVLVKPLVTRELLELIRSLMNDP